MELPKDRDGLAALIEREHWGRKRSIRSLEREFETSNGVISRWCQHHGIAVRTKREQASITNSQPNPNRPSGERHWAWGLKRPDRAEAMRVNNPMTNEDVRHRASLGIAEHARQNLSPAESAILAVLAPFGAVAQHVVGSYMIDVAFPDLRVGVELDGKIHGSPDRFASDLRRDAWLVGQGWRIVRVSNCAGRDPTKLVRVLKQFVPDLDESGMHPIKRMGPQYGVVIRDAETPTGRKV